MNEGAQLYLEQRFVEAGEALAKAIAAGATDPAVAYNAACSFALGGKLELALAQFRRAIELGWSDEVQAGADPDLASLRADRRWQDLVQRMQAKKDKQAEEKARLDSLAATAELPQLTEAEILADFDALSEIMAAVSPQTRIRQAVTGVDPLHELAAMRPFVSHARSAADFALLIERALNVFQDGHTSLIRRGYPRSMLREEGVSELAAALNDKYAEIFEKRDALLQLKLPLRVVAGEYYTVGEFAYDGKTFPKGMKVVVVDNLPVHQFVSGLFPYLRMMRWDFERHRYFSQGFLRSGTLADKGSVTLSFRAPDGVETTQTFKTTDSVGQAASPASAVDTKKVEWIADLGVLYVRMPAMSVADTQYYPQAIKQAGMGRSIRKIIFDIRGNGGGGDGVWMQALAAVIPEPIKLNIRIAYNRTPVVVDRLKFTSATRYAPTFLPGADYCLAESEEQIAPSPESLRFGGRIYVLQNESIFSSAGAFAAVAALADNVVSVGTRTGYLLGRGVNPLVFELPHSKIVFRVEPVIDLTNVHSPEDAFHDTVELPVELSIEDAIRRAAYQGDVYSKEFLAARDPIFMRALAD